MITQATNHTGFFCDFFFIPHLLCEELPEAGPPPHAEGDNPLILDELAGQLVDEAVGPEGPWLLPVRGVVHHVVEVGEHLGNIKQEDE